MTDIEILKEGIKALDSKKADDIRILKVRDLTILANYFVIVSGSSSTQVKALADEVDFKLGEKGYVYLPRQYIVHHRHQNLAHAFHHQS